MAIQLPETWFSDDVLSADDVERLEAPRALVAKKCTGRAKKPVLLFEHMIAKGPWRTYADQRRLRRALGRVALMRHWATDAYPDVVRAPRIFRHPNGDLYWVEPALYDPPDPKHPWRIEEECASASSVGPRILQIVSNTSTRVVNVGHRARVQLTYLDNHPEVWEHLIHRFLVGCGDSGLHNMLVCPASQDAVGIDLDENRSTRPRKPSAAFPWLRMLFRKSPSARILSLLEASRVRHRALLAQTLEHLRQRARDATSQQLAVCYHQDLSDVEARLDALTPALLQRPPLF